jgi:hypothetical protein
MVFLDFLEAVEKLGWQPCYLWGSSRRKTEGMTLVKRMGWEWSPSLIPELMGMASSLLNPQPPSPSIPYPEFHSTLLAYLLVSLPVAVACPGRYLHSYLIPSRH